MCADLLSDAAFDNLESVPFVFTRPVFWGAAGKARWRRQYLHGTEIIAVFTANILYIFCICPAQILAYNKDVLEELYVLSIEEKMDMRRGVLTQRICQKSR